MAIPIKSAHSIEKMRIAGDITAEVLADVCAAVGEGVSTFELDQLAAEFLREKGATSPCLGYGGPKNPYPGSICLSINDEVVHGVPRKDKLLRNGDIVSVDLVAEYDGFMGDSTRTVAVGEISSEVRNLLQWTEEALRIGIQQAIAGQQVGDISAAIQNYAESRSLGVVRELVGHGIGRKMHEEPQVPNWGIAGTGPRLRPGMTIAIEPMLTLGSHLLHFDNDGWTVRTADGSWAAHFEHTILITKGQPEVLTIKKN